MDEMRENTMPIIGLGSQHQMYALPEIAWKGLFVMTRYEVGKVNGSRLRGRFVDWGCFL